jgi:translation initiation factor 3 subunit I
LTQIKYNAEGDLLFTCSKDSVINVWYTHNGERLGTYEGHNGSVWTVDVDCRLYHPFFRPSVFLHVIGPWLLLAESKYMISGAADNALKLWSVATGRCLYTWNLPTAIKRVAFSEDDTQIVCITEQRMGYQGAIRIYTLNRGGDGMKRAFGSIIHSAKSPTVPSVPFL